MKARTTCFIAFWAAVMMPLVPSSAASTHTIFGAWQTDDGAAIIRIDLCGSTLCGKIERVLDPKAPANDINNPDPSKRSHPLIGTIILSDFAGSGTVWKNGSAYDPKAGRSYRSSLTIQGDGKLKVTGCVLFVCRSRYWIRAER